MLPSTLHCPQPSEYPPPQDDYQQSFHDLKGATQASDYLTYGLVDTVAGMLSSLLFVAQSMRN